MQSIHLRRCCALGLPLLLLLLLCVAVGGPERLGLDFWNASHHEAQIEQADLPQDPLDDVLVRLRRSQMLKDRIIEDLLAQRLTLLEAASHYDTVSEMPLGLDYFAGDTRAERLCRRIIWEACMNCRKHPEFCAQVMLELDNELRDHLRSYGTPELPQPDLEYLFQIEGELLLFGLNANR